MWSDNIFGDKIFGRATTYELAKVEQSNPRSRNNLLY